MSRIGFKNDYCWVVTYHINKVGAPVILTTETRWEALEHILPIIVEKLKSKYPRVKWTEVNLDKIQNTRITEYGIYALGNPDLYVKAYKSNYTNGLEESYELE